MFMLISKCFKKIKLDLNLIENKIRSESYSLQPKGAYTTVLKITEILGSKAILSMSTYFSLKFSCFVLDINIY